MSATPTTVVNDPYKGFAWSFSHLKNYETCPKRYYHYQVARDVTEPESPQLRDGNTLHHNFEKRLLEDTPLPIGYGQYEKMLASIQAAPGKTYGEQKLALTSSFTPVSFFGKNVWLRTVIDAMKIYETQATIMDWKTGKVASDITQLQIMAATVFHQDARIERVKAALVFVAYGQVERAEFVRGDVTEIWSEILPRVNRIRDARQTMEFPPKPSGLCKKYCAVVSCPFHGRGG